ncbi:MAG: 50S ribosomal protein L15 [Chitinophagaceae bacterium]|nr:50S ribosomal protein L15 [Chitinophagaceae bacterium]
MKLHELAPAKGAVHKKKRVGRGDASGHGGTSTRGTKGQQSRSGYSRKLGHEGGQMPIQRRVPKRGFKNPFRTEYKIFNLSQAEQLVAKYKFTEFSLENLYANKLIQRNDKVKILGKGELKSPLSFKVNAVSEKAKAAIESAGGNVQIIG